MEATNAERLQKPILFVRADRNYEPDGWLANMMHKHPIFDLAENPNLLNELIGQIRKMSSTSSHDPECDSGESDSPQKRLAINDEQMFHQTKYVK